MTEGILNKEQGLLPVFNVSVLLNLQLQELLLLFL